MVFFIKILSYDLITGQGIANLTARADLPAGIYGVSLVPDGDILRNNNINIKQAICILGLEFAHSDPGFLIRSNAAFGWIALFSLPHQNLTLVGFSDATLSR